MAQEEGRSKKKSSCKETMLKSRGCSRKKKKGKLDRQERKITGSPHLIHDHWKQNKCV